MGILVKGTKVEVYDHTNNYLGLGTYEGQVSITEAFGEFSQDKLFDCAAGLEVDISVIKQFLDIEGTTGIIRLEDGSVLYGLEVYVWPFDVNPVLN